MTTEHLADRPGVAVGAGSPRMAARAEALAREMRLPLLDPIDEGSRGFDWFLIVGEDYLELREACDRKATGLYVDFVGGPVGYRRISGTSRRQPLARAAGLRRGYRSVLDATAGLGRDAFQLACLGCTVVAVERSPILAALVRDGLARAAAHENQGLRRVIERIQLVTCDARVFLMNLSEQERPEVVYVDPMYSSYGQSSLNKKEMRICRKLVGDDVDAGELLRIARKAAHRRVVVKRPRTAPPLARGMVAKCVGRRVRYDVYPPEMGIAGQLQPPVSANHRWAMDGPRSGGV